MAQEGPPVSDPVEKRTAPAGPTIAVNHLGFRSHLGSKVLVLVTKPPPTLRKWMDVTMLNGIALLNLMRNIPEPGPGDISHEQMLEEVRFGNRYSLKMQDSDGKVWADTAGGVNGDNSDNHWTDNVVGTSDDRYINVEKRSEVAAIFATLQALVAQSYLRSDPDCAKQCLQAGVRAWSAFGAPKTTLELGWWTMATCELFARHKIPYTAGTRP
jgi:hypothetical protein